MTTGHESAQGPGPAPADWASLAERAGRSVHARFGHRLMGLPGTWMGAISIPVPQPQTPWSDWHYWWQVHFLDALVDAGLRSWRSGDHDAAGAAARAARALLRGILLRNFLRFPNYFYDDMAWLALAAGRLQELSLLASGKPARLAKHAVRGLGRQLNRAHDDVLGGGLYWSRKRDYKNTPVNGPAALHFARSGDPQTAKAVLDWLHAELFDPATGLYLDGIHPSATGRDVERTIYSYNQGTVLAALLRCGDPAGLDRAAELVAAVGRELTDPATGALRHDTDGDAGLFTGILCRYLALASVDSRLPLPTRTTAANLVRATATVLLGEAEPVQLSGAVQRWTVLEAAATLGPG